MLGFIVASAACLAALVLNDFAESTTDGFVASDSWGGRAFFAFEIPALPPVVAFLVSRYEGMEAP